MLGPKAASLQNDDSILHHLAKHKDLNKILRSRTLYVYSVSRNNRGGDGTWGGGWTESVCGMWVGDGFLEAQSLFSARGVGGGCPEPVCELRVPPPIITRYRVQTMRIKA